MAEQISLYQRFTAGIPFQLFGGDAGLPSVPTPAPGVYAVSAVFTIRNLPTDPDGSAVLQKTIAGGAITIRDGGASSGAASFSCLLSASDTTLIGSSVLRVYDLRVTWSDGSAAIYYSGPVMAVAGPAAVTAVASVVLAPSPLSIAAGDSQQLTLTAYDGPNGTGNVLSLTGRAVVIGSSNEAVLIVSASLIAAGRAAGSANITASVDGVAATPLAATVTPVNFGGIVPAGATAVARRPALKSRDTKTLEAVFVALASAAPLESSTQLGARLIQHRINPDALYGWSTVDRWLDVDTQATGAAAIAAGCAPFTKLQFGAFRRVLKGRGYTIANGPNFGPALFASIQLHPLLHTMVPSASEVLIKEYDFDDYGDEWTGAVPARSELSSNPAVGFMDTVALNSQLRTTATEGQTNISVQRGSVVSNVLTLYNELRLFTPADLNAAFPGGSWSAMWDRRIGRTIDVATSKLTQWDSCVGTPTSMIGGKNQGSPLNNCPVWDPLLSRIVFDATAFGGTYMQTALSTMFDFSGAYTFILIGALTNHAALRYAAILTNAGFASYLGLEQTAAGFLAGEGGGQQLISTGTVVTGTRRVLIMSKDAGTGYAFDAPDKAQVTATGSAAPSVQRALAIGALVAPGGSPSAGTSGCIDFIGIMPRKITPSEVTLVRRFAVNAHLGVAA